jgi:hypothetical protein
MSVHLMMFSIFSTVLIQLAEDQVSEKMKEVCGS